MSIAVSAPVPAYAKSHRGIVTLCTMAATLMQALDNTIANVALPYMQSSLSTTIDQITWVLTSYVVAAAIFTAPVGWLSSRFGRKSLFILCLTGFTVASMLCGLATSLSQMVLFRLLQGTFGAALVPLSQATLLDLYPIEQRGQAMAMWGMGVMVGPILGPTLGGYLTDAYNWRWVFYVNVPFGIAAVVGLLFFMKETDRNAAQKFDWSGFAFLSLGLAALQLMLDRGEQKDWFNSTEIIVELVLACLGFYLFVVHMFTHDKPFIPPRIFKDRNFLASLFIMFVMGMLLLSSSALLPAYLQVLGGYSITETGMLMAPRGVGTMMSMMIAGKLASKTDPRRVIAFGAVLLSGTMYEMTFWTPDVSVTTLTVTSVIQGVGMGFIFIPLQLLAFATLAPDLRGDGTALYSLIRNVGSAVGISIVMFNLSQASNTMHARLAEGLTPFNRLLTWGSAKLFWNTDSAAGLMALNAEVSRQASIIAYANDFRLMLYLSLPTILLLLLLRRPARPQAVSMKDAVVD